MATVTVPEETPRKQVALNGTPQTTFTFDWTIFDEDADIEVYLDTTKLTYSTHFTVTGTAGTEGGFDGGTVTMAGAYVAGLSTADGATVTIARAVPVQRVTNFPTSGPFDINALNEELNRLVALVQQTVRDISLAIRLPVTTTESGGFEFPDPSASALIAWNSGGTALENKTVASIGAVTVPGSSTDNALVRFDGTSGTAFQNSPVTVDDAGAIAGVTTLNGTTVSNLLDTDDIGVTVQGYDPDILKADADATVSARIKPAVQSVSSSSGAITLDFSSGGTTKRTTLTENISSITVSGLTDGMVVEWWITQAAANSYTVTGYPTIIWNRDGAEPEMPSTFGAKMFVQFRLDDTAVVGVA
jgi:hypothetical protein